MNTAEREAALRWVIDSYRNVPVDGVIARLNQMLDGLFEDYPEEEEYLDDDPEEDDYLEDGPEEDDYLEEEPKWDDYEASLISYLGRPLSDDEIFGLRRIWFWVYENLYGEE